MIAGFVQCTKIPPRVVNRNCDAGVAETRRKGEASGQALCIGPWACLRSASRDQKSRSISPRCHMSTDARLPWWECRAFLFFAAILLWQQSFCRSSLLAAATLKPFGINPFGINHAWYQPSSNFGADETQAVVPTSGLYRWSLSTENTPGEHALSEVMLSEVVLSEVVLSRHGEPSSTSGSSVTTRSGGTLRSGRFCPVNILGKFSLPANQNLKSLLRRSRNYPVNWSKNSGKHTLSSQLFYPANPVAELVGHNRWDLICAKG